MGAWSAKLKEIHVAQSSKEVERSILWAELKKVAEAQDHQAKDMEAAILSLKKGEEVLDTTMAEACRNLMELHKRELETR